MRRWARSWSPILSLQLLLACSDQTPTAPSDDIHLPEPNTPDGPNALVVSWLKDHVLPFDTPVIREDRSDLSFLSSLVGDARIVALGQATWPEMNRIDDWVHGGEGDPAVLLSGQYFWAWNTQEVMDLIAWARGFNLGRPAEDQVSVRGFDMQYAGMAIHNVLTFLEEVDAEAASASVVDYACYLPLHRRER